MILQGDPNLSTSLVSLKAMWKALRQQGEGVLVELGSIGVLGNKVEQAIPRGANETTRELLELDSVKTRLELELDSKC